MPFSRAKEATTMRRLYAAALIAISSWGWISPPQAFAQLLPPLPGSLVVTITSPAADTTVDGTITVRASVSPAGVLIGGVQFQLDGVNLGAEVMGAPYSVSWDTTTTSNAFHTLRAVARNALGIRFASDPVTVTVSNSSPPPPPPTVTRVEETDPSITYTGDWFPADPRTWSGGTAVYSTTAGNEATLAFTGTAVDWIGFLGPQTGIARVFLDGVLAAEVDTYSPTEQTQVVVFRATSLANASHTLTIEVTGQQNPASTGAYVVVDAFDVTR
jgi:Big-like domain-containing protein